MDTVIILLIPFLIGLGVNYAYDYIKHRKKFRKSNASPILGLYKMFWYNTKYIKNRDTNDISQATIKIDKDWLSRIRVTLLEDIVINDMYEKYEYSGFMTLTESQIHWKLIGHNHSEEIYAVFDRGLRRDIEIMSGIVLLTSNDKYCKPMAIRCIVSRDDVEMNRIKIFWVQRIT